MNTRARQLAFPAVPRLTSITGAGALVTLGYFILVGGSSVGELQPLPRLVSTILAGAFIAAYLWRAPARADALDRTVLLAVLFFAGAAIASHFPRQSLDAALGALAYAAGFFVAREFFASDRWRVWFVRSLIAMSLLLTIVTVIRWLPPVAGVMSISDLALPPLSLELRAEPWGHRYDLALLIAMLYPAWWVGHPSRFRRTAAVIVGVLVLIVVVITGSRTLWAGIVVASIWSAIPLFRRHWQRTAAIRLPILAAVIGVSVVLLMSGVLSSMAQRALSLDTLAFRTAMWGPLLEAWSTQPVAGFGPGSFPWILQLTAYFDVNSFSPRHPDSAMIQALVEAGLLGLLAMLLIVLTVLPAILRGRSTAARWSILVFAVACIGGNPSDFTFIVVVVVAWAAYAVPHLSTAPRSVRGPARPVTLIAFASIVVVGAAIQVAALSYERARVAVASGDVGDAALALDLAVTLDPAMAIYVRQRGTLAYLAGDFHTAVADLERAVATNPADDLAWRSLALAYVATDRNEAGREALDRALSLRRSSATNLLLSARFDGRAGRGRAAQELLAEVVQTWPEIVGAPGWRRFLPASITTADLVDSAASRWEAGVPALEPTFDQPLWLVAFADRRDLEERAVAEARIGPILGRATIAMTRCDTAAAKLLDAATESDRRNPVYRALRQRASYVTAAGENTAEILATADPEIASAARRSLNPLNGNGVFDADAWGYRRPSIQWTSGAEDLPSPSAGAARWAILPHEAVREAELDDRLPLCS